MTEPKSSKPRCFVAMAIGRDDMDRVYDSCIRTAIHDSGLLAIRVDRIVHNDRVDHRIREEIAKADVLVADLTYARPSVYWEAGFAERVVPVIYTCRRDHLKHADSDIHGNLTVHFDLRNANLITWSGHGDQAFKHELRKRLRHVMRGAQEKQEADRRLLVERSVFAQQSLAERRFNVSKRMEGIVRERGFVPLKSKDQVRSALGHDGLYKDETQLFWTRNGGTAIIVGPSYCFASMLKKDLQWSRFAPIIDSVENDRFIEWGKVAGEIMGLTRRRVRAIRRVRIVPILKRLPEARVQQVFEHWRRLPIIDLYYRRGFAKPYFLADVNAPLMPTSSEVLFLHGILSEPEFEDMLNRALDEIESTLLTVVMP